MRVEALATAPNIEQLNTSHRTTHSSADIDCDLETGIQLEPDSCLICLETFDSPKPIAVTEKCSSASTEYNLRAHGSHNNPVVILHETGSTPHKFHLDCIKPWIETKLECPTCREPVTRSTCEALGIEPPQKRSAISQDYLFPIASGIVGSATLSAWVFSQINDLDSYSVEELSTRLAQSILGGFVAGAGLSLIISFLSQSCRSDSIT